MPSLGHWRFDDETLDSLRNLAFVVDNGGVDPVAAARRINTILGNCPAQERLRLIERLTGITADTREQLLQALLLSAMLAADSSQHRPSDRQTGRRSNGRR